MEPCSDSISVVENVSYKQILNLDHFDSSSDKKIGPYGQWKYNMVPKENF